MVLRAAKDVEIRRSVYVPRCKLGIHHHSEERIVLPLTGSFKTQYGRHRIDIPESSALYRPRWDEHQDFYGRQITCISVSFLSDNIRKARTPDEPFVITAQGMKSLAHRMSLEMNNCDPASSLILEGLVLQVVSAVLHRRPLPQRGRPGWIQLIREQLDEQYLNPPSLAALSATVDRDAAYVAASFKSVYGTPIGEYVRQLRLWHVRKLLDTDPSIGLAEVAQRGGFADQSHLTRHFKRQFSIPPAQYRRRQGFLHAGIFDRHTP